MVRRAALASSVVASMPTVFPLTDPTSASLCRIPVEHGLVSFEIDQATCARDRRMVRRRLRPRQPEKLAQRKRIGCSPCDRALRVQTFEIPDQQQPEVAPRQQPRPAVVRVTRVAQALDVSVEVVPVEDLIQSRVEGMRGTPRQVLGRHPHRRLRRVPLSCTHRHRRQYSTRDRSYPSRIQGFTTGR